MNSKYKKLAMFSGTVLILLFLSSAIFGRANFLTTLFFGTPVQYSVKSEVEPSITVILNNTSKMTPEKSSLQSCAELTSRFIPSKPTNTVINSGQSHERIIVRFVNTSGIRLREGKLISLNGVDLHSLNIVLNSFKPQIRRLYSDPEEKFDKERLKLEAETCKEFPDMNLAYLFILETSQDAEKFIDLLNALPIVEIAYPESTVVNP